MLLIVFYELLQTPQIHSDEKYWVIILIINATFYRCCFFAKFKVGNNVYLYTRSGSTFTFKLKPHYVCFNLRPGGGTAIYGLGTYLPLRQVGFCLSSSVWRVDKNQRILAYIGYHLWDIDQLYVNSEFLAYSKSGIEKWFIDLVYCLSDGIPSRTPQPKFLECPLPPSTTPLPDSDASAVHSFLSSVGNHSVLT